MSLSQEEMFRQYAAFEADMVESSDGLIDNLVKPNQEISEIVSKHIRLYKEYIFYLKNGLEYETYDNIVLAAGLYWEASKRGKALAIKYRKIIKEPYELLEGAEFVFHILERCQFNQGIQNLSSKAYRRNISLARRLKLPKEYIELLKTHQKITQFTPRPRERIRCAREGLALADGLYQSTGKKQFLRFSSFFQKLIDNRNCMT